jgi:NTE family protein
MTRGSVLKFTFLIALTMNCFACAGKPLKTSPQEEAYAGKEGVPELYGPAQPPASDIYGPEKPTIRPIVLVLGPGMARGYAYAGVFRALAEARIPIGAILGTEMGSLMGALYATRGNINDFEWALLKLKKDVFKSEKSFFTKYFDPNSTDKKLESALKDIFGTKTLESSKIQLKVALESESNHSLTVFSAGPAAQILRAALATPGVFSSVSSPYWKGDLLRASTLAKPFLVTEARLIGMGPIVVLDLIHTPPLYPKEEIDNFMSAAAENSETELRGADLVIRPDLRDVGYLDFHKQMDAIYRGKLAVLSHMDEIKKLISGKHLDKNP